MTGVGAPLFLGIDLGTSRLKLHLIDANANPVAEASATVPMLIPRHGWAEQSPADWWDALITACRDLFGQDNINPAQIAAVGLTGQMHGATFLDGNGEVLRPCLIWADNRNAGQVEQIKQAIPHADLISITGNVPNTGFTAPKIMWVREHEPHVYRRTAHILLPKDYLRFRLTGRYATDVSDASATLLFDLHERGWSNRLLSALKIERDLLPNAYESHVITGHITTEASHATGIRAGVPVVAGGGDAECGALGLGLSGGQSDEGVLLVSLGTAGQIFAVTQSPVTDPSGRVHSLCHVVENRWHVMGAILSGGLSLDWVRNLMGETANNYKQLTSEAASAGIGAEGVLFLPYLLGERTPHMDPNARAGFFGLGLHHTRAHILRAVMEGVAFALRDGLEVLREIGVNTTEARLAGGGAKSKLWKAILRDVLNLPVRTGLAEHGSAYGAALLAAVGMGAFENVDAALAGKAWGELEQPVQANAEQYEAIFRQYKRLYPATK